MNFIEAEELIEFASFNPPTIFESVKWSRTAALISNRFLSRKINFSEFLQRYQSIPYYGRIMLNQKEDFRLVLSCLGLKHHEIEQKVAHESAHAEVAQSYGVVAMYGIQIIRDSIQLLRKPYFDHVSTHLIFTSVMDGDLARQVLREALLAPGENMSESDRLSLPEMTKGW